MKILGIHVILDETWEECEEIKEKAISLAKEVEELDGRLLLAINDRDNLNKKNEELEKEILNLGSSLSDVKKELTTSRDSNKKLMSSIKEKGDKIKDLEKEIKELKEENKEREDYIGKLLEQNKDYSNKVYSLNADKGGYVKKIKDLEGEIDSLNASMKEKESEATFIPDESTATVLPEAAKDERVADHYEANTVQDEGVAPIMDSFDIKEDKPSEVVHTPKNKKKKKNRH